MSRWHDWIDPFWWATLPLWQRVLLALGWAAVLTMLVAIIYALLMGVPEETR